VHRLVAVAVLLVGLVGECFDDADVLLELRGRDLGRDRWPPCFKSYRRRTRPSSPAATRACGSLRPLNPPVVLW